MGEVADLLDEQVNQVVRASRVIDEKLGEMVSDSGGLPSVLAATVAQTMLEVAREGAEGIKGRFDVLRLGRGVARGDLQGIVDDLGRVAAVVPMASALRATGVTAFTALRTAVGLRRAVQGEFKKLVEEIYQKEVKRLMRSRRALTPQVIGTEADKRTKEILEKMFEGLMEIYFDVPTETTKGAEGDANTMNNTDVIAPLFLTALELKKSPRAVKRIQKLAQKAQCRIYGYWLAHVYGHL